MSNERVPWSKDLDKMKYCPECGARRGNQKANWAPVLRKDQIIGWTCPECPSNDEPIRRWGKTRERFRAVVDATPKGSLQRKQATKTFYSLEDARAWVDSMKLEVARHGSVTRTRLTVDQLLDQWEKSLERVRPGESEPRIKPSTRLRYADQVKSVRRFMGDRLVTDLETEDIDALTTWLASEGKESQNPAKRAAGEGSTGYGRWAIIAARGRLSQALDLAVEEYGLKENVVRKAGPYRPASSDKEEVPHWEVIGDGAEATCPSRDAFMRVSDQDRYAPLWRLTLCGATRADVMGLRWSDLDLDAGDATIARGRVILDGKADHVDKPKSKKRERPIPFEVMLPGTVDLFEALKDRQKVEAMEIGRVWSEGDFVATNEIGEPLRPELWSDWFKRLCKEAGVPVIRLHAARHTLAFLLDRKGGSAKIGAALLGHSEKIHEATYRPRDTRHRCESAARLLAPTA